MHFDDRIRRKSATRKMRKSITTAENSRIEDIDDENFVCYDKLSKSTRRTRFSIFRLLFVVDSPQLNRLPEHD